MSQKVTVETYQLVRSKRSTIAVEVHPDLQIVVRAPRWTPLREIESFLQDRVVWIQDRLAKARQTLQSLPALTNPGEVHHRGAVIHWPYSPSRFATWEKVEAERLCLDHIRELLPGLGVHGLRYNGLKLRRMRRRWGSCSYSGIIVLNTLLVRVPDHCSKAVVAHELAHLVHMNHGPAFKRQVVELYPDYLAANKELDQWTSMLLSANPNGRASKSIGRGERRELRLLG